MILLYLSMLFLLVLTKMLVGRRAARLEKKYTKVATEATGLASQPQYRAGNGNQPRDAYQHAKRQYVLGQLVHKRDRVEASYTRWQGMAEKLDKAIAKLRGMKGKTLPYLLGVVDLVLLVLALDMITPNESLSVQTVKEMLRGLFS